MGLLRLYTNILEENKSDIRMFEECGLVVEVKLRKHAFKEGKFKDVIVMGICASDLLSWRINNG